MRENVISQESQRQPQRGFKDLSDMLRGQTEEKKNGDSSKLKAMTGEGQWWFMEGILKMGHPGA